VDVWRHDKTTTTQDGKIIREVVRKHHYIWLENEHPDEKKWTDKQIEEKYAPIAPFVEEETYYANSKGELVLVETESAEGNLHYTYPGE
jgi:hypothetical protein